MIRWEKLEHTSVLFDGSSEWHRGYIGGEWVYVYFKDSKQAGPPLTRGQYLLCKVDSERASAATPLAGASWLGTRSSEESVRQLAENQVPDLVHLAALGREAP